MGEVWRARDTRLDRLVAVKIIAGAIAEDQRSRERFDQEAKAVSKLNHPNICSLFDVGYNGSHAYLVMELCDGETLADRLKRGPLNPLEVARYGAEIADALGHAHRERIVHRDLKPGNVMITRSGAKLLDFGLAKQSAEPIGKDSETLPTPAPLTTEGVIVGTVPYMSPEQISGEPIDHRSDIFALGSVLFEMTTGRRAFEGSDRLAIIANILRESPRKVSVLAPQAPPVLRHVIEKCLEKSRDSRWQSAYDVAEELRWSSNTDLDLAMTVVGRQRLRDQPLLIAAVIALCLVGTLAGFVARGKFRSAAPRYAFINPYTMAGYDQADFGVISPDGQSIVFAARSPDRRRLLFVRRLDSLMATLVAGTDGALAPQWSHDGRDIYYWANNKYMRIAASGGAPQAFVDASDEYGLTTNAQGVALAGVGEQGIIRIDPGNKAVAITTLNRNRGERAHIFPVFLPDGKHFLFIAQIGGDPPRLHLYGGTLDSTKTVDVGEVTSRVEYMEPGFLLMVRDGDLLAVPFNDSAMRLKPGNAIPIAQSVRFFPATGIADFSVSTQGTLTCRAAEDRFALHWVSSKGVVGDAVGDPVTYALPPMCRLGDDQRSLLVTIADAKRGTRDLWQVDVKSGAKHRLTYGCGEEVIGVWAGGMTGVYYSQMQKGWPDIFEKRIDGGERDRFVVGGADGQFPCDVSPDGRYLLYMTYQNVATATDLYFIKLDETPPQPRPYVATPAHEAETVESARFSPDGRWVAYLSDDTGSVQVYVKPFPGPGQARQLSTGDPATRVNWTSDGRQILYLRLRTLMAVDFDSASGLPGKTQPLFELPYDVITYEPTQDGRFLMLLATKADGATPTRVHTGVERLLK